MDVVLDGLPVHTGALVSVALVLVLGEASLKDDHSHGPNIAFVGVVVRLPHFHLERVS
jgi:hypothetical protein